MKSIQSDKCAFTLFIRTRHKRNIISNQTHPCLHQHHHSHCEKTMLIKFGRFELVLSEQLSTYETSIIKPIPSFCLIQITSHKRRQLVIGPFPHPSPDCSFRPRCWGSCHCHPSPPGKRRTSAAAPPPRFGLPQPPSAAASDLGRPGTGGRTHWIEPLCPRNLGNGLGVLKRQSHRFGPIVQESFE